MKSEEFAHVLGAVLLLFVVSAFAFVLAGEAFSVLQVFVFSFVVILVVVFVRKGAAYTMDASVTHKIWMLSRFGYRPKEHFKKPQPLGIYLPLILSICSLGFVKIMTFLTYETSALKHRAAKRFGFYSYTEMTDSHNGLIGASSIFALLVLAVAAYVFDMSLLARMAIYYSFWNMIPFSDLDGTQIFFGGRVLWTVLAVIVMIFTLYAIILI